MSLRGLVSIGFMMLMATGCASHVQSVETAPAAVSVKSLVPQFDAAALKILQLPEDQRFDSFQSEIVPILPGFYKPGERATPEKYRASVLKNLAAYPAQRDKILAVATAFDRRMAGADTRFRRFFPDYRPTMPTYLVYSFGQMDGGTREFDGKVNLLFGADMIAKIHDDETMGPLFDHELFHAYHEKYFHECEQIWCSLWMEGLAVYVTAQMNPGVTDKGLLLNFPQPIRATVEPHIGNAAASIRAVLDSRDDKDYEPLFFGSQPDPPNAFPPRYGYYVGYRAVEKLAGKKTIQELAKMPASEVRPLIEKALLELEQK